MGKITGISRTSLWNAWKAIRKQLRRSSRRDIVDHLEYDVDPDVWINRLLSQISEGEYDPQSPSRFPVAKSKGFTRIITAPSIPDLVLYRAIVDYLYMKTRRREAPHVYFEVTKLHKATASAHETGKYEMEYATGDKKRFLAWLRYDQYRKYLIFRDTYKYIVVADITNFFDSVLHGRVAELFHRTSTPGGMLGLLFFILERLSIRDSYGESPKIGLPVDQFDCSRRLAHMFLFAHDDRMIAEVGEKSYVRWMDDQNLGVRTYAEGLKSLQVLGESLRRIHLTPNSAKTRILSLREAKRHFHLDLNAGLDKIEKMPRATAAERTAAAHRLERLMSRIKRREGQGEWEKVVKRAYRIAALVKWKGLRARAHEDIIHYPTLVQRIADYMRCTGGAAAYFQFAESLWLDDRQVYEDVNLTLVESLLRLELPKTAAHRARGVASDILKERWHHLGASSARRIAPLLVLRFGDKRSLPLLKRSFKAPGLDRNPPEVVRASAIVYASFGVPEYRFVRATAAKMPRNELAFAIRLIDRIREAKSVPDSYKARLNLQYDPVADRSFVDMRSLLAARLLKLNGRKDIQAYIESRKAEWSKKVSNFDQRLVDRLLAF